MARLLELARRYQHALDGLSESTRDAASAAGLALWRAVPPEMTGGQRNRDLRKLEPIVLRTTLATTMVTYLERIPWGKVTLQMLMHPEGTHIRKRASAADFSKCSWRAHMIRLKSLILAARLGSFCCGRCDPLEPGRILKPEVYVWNTEPGPNLLF